MSVKLLTEHHLEFLSLKGSCTGSLSRVTDQLCVYVIANIFSVMLGRFSVFLGEPVLIRRQGFLLKTMTPVSLELVYTRSQV